MNRTPRLIIALVIGLAACTPPPAAPSASAPSAVPSGSAPGTVILIGKIVTLSDPPIAEAIAFEDGEVVAVGTAAEVSAAYGGATIVELGPNVAYPGFIDAHSHWVGDRPTMGIEDAEEALDAAVSRGWTSIAELWNDQDRLDELLDLAEADGLPVRVDAYLALNEPGPDGTHLGDWYVAYRPGEVTGRLRTLGVKITLDNGWGTRFWWEQEDLDETVVRASNAGWQVATHAVSMEAHDMILAAYKAAIGTGSNPLHHRIEHAIQVTDDQLDQIVALDLAIVAHLDGASADWVLESDYLGNLGENPAWLARWRDFVDAGLHVAGATDAPWLFPNFTLTDDVGRPMDQVAGGMDAIGRSNPEPPTWALNQLLTADQAIRAITLDAAYAIDDEDNRGHLAPGTYADITILSGDMAAAQPADIREMTVIATIVGGITEFCSDEAFCP